MPQRRATIAHIAERAGVSIGTASNVFNGKGRFTEETRERVMQAALDMNFTPNALIRSLQSGRTRSIGVFSWAITTNTTRDISMLLLRGVLEGIAKAGCDTLFYSRHPHIGEVSVTLFLDRRVDGLILCPGGIPLEGLQTLANCGLPTVALYHGPVPAGIGAVNIDNASGVRAGMEHLIGLGHRRIAFYTPIDTFDFSERFRAYRDSLERSGLPLDPALQCVVGGNHHATARSALAALLSLPQPPTAILAGDDSVALSLIEAARERGLRTPEDISVVGFDDAPDAGLPPGLTTARQPAAEVGRVAAGFVERLLAGESAENCRVTLPVEFVIRNTTAPP